MERGSSNRLILIAKKDSAHEIFDKELFNALSEKEIFIKILADEVFDLMFSNPKEIEVDLSEETFSFIAKSAHDRDITFNQMVNIIIREQIEKEKDLVGD